MNKIILALFTSLLFCNSAHSQSPEDLYNQASDQFDKEDYSSAILLVNKALKSDSVNSKYLLLKGNIYFNTRQYEDAFKTYSLGIRYNPTDAYLYNQRGLLLKKIQETEYAIKDYNTALKLNNPDSVKLTLLLNRGASKIDVRDFQGAYEDFNEALKLDSLNIGTLNNLATVCDEVGKGDLTLNYLYRIIKLDSTFIGAYGNIGFKYQEMGDHKTAIEFFNKVLELSPNEPLAFSNRAYNNYKLGNYSSALTDINSSISLYPANSYAFRTRALIYLALKENNKACNDIEEALNLGFTKMYGDAAEILKKENCNR